MFRAFFHRHGPHHPALGLGLGALHAAWGMQTPKPILWCAGDGLEDAGLEKLKRKLGGGTDTAHFAKRLPKLSWKEIAEGCFEPGYFEGKGVDMIKPGKDKGREIKAIVRSLLGITADIPLDTQEDSLAGSQESQTTGEAAPSISAPMAPSVPVVTPSSFGAGLDTTSAKDAPKKRIGERGVAKRDDIWHDVVITGFSDGMWLVQDIFQDVVGKVWFAKDVYQAGEVGGDTRWIQGGLEASAKILTDLGAGKANDCWYLSAEAALKEFGQTQGNPEEFRKKLAKYGREHVLPSYGADDPGRKHAIEAINRIENGDMAESPEVKWTANLTGFIIFMYSERYGLSGGAAGVSHNKRVDICGYSGTRKSLKVGFALGMSKTC